MTNIDDMIEVENINVPGRVSRVNAVKYDALKKVLLEILPEKAPGLTQKEMMVQVSEKVPQDLFPGGAKSGWWMKTVKLDLEAKKTIKRTSTKPLQWHLM